MRYYTPPRTISERLVDAAFHLIIPVALLAIIVGAWGIIYALGG